MERNTTPQSQQDSGDDNQQRQQLGSADATDQAFNDLDVQEELQRIEAELRDAHERALRSQAELENYRKRVRREIEDERRYAAVPLITDLLPVVDNLERALQAAQQQESAAGLVEGVRMVFQQLVNVLEQHHCRRIEAEGAAFDPHRHEAVGQERTSDHEPGVVARVVRIGYQLHDRVIRPSQVLVAAPADQQPGQTE